MEEECVNISKRGVTFIGRFAQLWIVFQRPAEPDRDQWIHKFKSTSGKKSFTPSY